VDNIIPIQRYIITIFLCFKYNNFCKPYVIEDKIIRYRTELKLAKTLAKKKYADQNQYENLAFNLEKILKFYEDLKVWKDLSLD